jgi:hypothetical protein
MNISIPNFNDVYNYFLLQQEDEAYTARIRFEKAILASIHAEEEATHEAEEEISCAPLYMAEEQAVAQDGIRKAKHRKDRRAERDEYHYHRKPIHKWNREACNEFALNRKAEKRRLNTHNFLSDYEAEEQAEERWAEKEQKKSDLYMNGEDYVDYVWENTIHENGLNDLWKSVSEDGHFSYSCPEDFGNKFFEVIEDENDYCYDYNDYDDTRDDLNGDDYAYNHGYKAGYEDGYEKGYTTGGEIGYNRGYTTGLHKGREEGRKYVLDLLKQVGINIDLEALIEQSLK